ncbi:D-Ala-D-Ala carboxypeptidase family metallohydrolase [Actinomadura sp. SCN-SB]|uniref:D-Ala-D-Ala carboxypeptidase family metallohydrolase n=1 Tax=Actinomadura sp. SCN-SB TaxID=3373092 RepID=UPI003753AE1B
MSSADFQIFAADPREAADPSSYQTDPGIVTPAAGPTEYESEWNESAVYAPEAAYSEAAVYSEAGTSPQVEQEHEAEGPETAEWELFSQFAAASAAGAFPSGLVLATTTGAIGKDEEHWDPSGVNLPLYRTGPEVHAQKLSANFTVGELIRSGQHRADPARISVELVRALQAIRDRLGLPIGISSGYRSWAYNVALYKSRNQTPTQSRHCSGQAADISAPGKTGMDLAKLAIETLGDGIGVGIADGYAHVDVRGSWSRWTYYTGTKDTAAKAEIDAFLAKWRASGGRPSSGHGTPATGGSWVPRPQGPPAAVPSTASGKPQPRTTSFLNTAWARYACVDKDMVDLQVLSTRTPVNPLTVDAWTALAQALRSTGYEAKGTWSYTCRLIANSTQRSLHSFGIALDIDPSENPHLMNTVGPVRFSAAPTRAGRSADVAAGRADTVFTPQQIAAVEAIRTVDGLRVFAWGGRWTSSHDSMHFQIDLTPDELSRGIAPPTR